MNMLEKILQLKENQLKLKLFNFPRKLLKENISFSVDMFKGTYIRVLGKEIAEKLETVGHLDSLKN